MQRKLDREGHAIASETSSFQIYIYSSAGIIDRQYKESINPDSSAYVQTFACPKHKRCQITFYILTFIHLVIKNSMHYLQFFKRRNRYKVNKTNLKSKERKIL